MWLETRKRLLFLHLLLMVAMVAGGGSAVAQQKIAYIDSEYIYSSVPEFATAQQSLDRMVQQWESELRQKQEEVDEQFRQYQARELLYTQDERQRQQEEITAAEEEVERLRFLYFGPEGELFKQQEQILKPLQERVLIAIEEIAVAEDYDYVFDRSGDFIFLYTTDRHDLSLEVLDKLGVEITAALRNRTSTGSQ